eukprot:gene10739-biopygen3316
MQITHHPTNNPTNRVAAFSAVSGLSGLSVDPPPHESRKRYHSKDLVRDRGKKQSLCILWGVGAPAASTPLFPRDEDSFDRTQAAGLTPLAKIPVISDGRQWLDGVGNPPTHTRERGDQPLRMGCSRELNV